MLYSARRVGFGESLPRHQFSDFLLSYSKTAPNGAAFANLPTKFTTADIALPHWTSLSAFS